MQNKYPELEGWLFEIEEVSANVYRIVAQNQFGNKIEARGTNPDELLEKCKEDAFKMTESFKNL